MGLLNKPANNGVAEAQFVLGYLLLNGEGGVKQDVPHALSMIEMAGNSGFQKAKWFVCFLLACPVSWQVASVFDVSCVCALWSRYLANCYMNGHGVAKDQRKATTLLQEAALKGHADSAFELFQTFSKGSGLEQESQQWLKRAAQAGHAEAKKLLKK